ncbi:hypothetical protein AMATHDRAFT_65916 [Amanita thiersii Skay4041]|uniref:Metallo-beta-lactamase domain-containing protein n=1 Tax=Amanita thiersii Skay4041 TaxID=703135 RepID=A0A2A9NCB4_9AGAR|nr:hypothetical protein AMATHDRAFT_65916 [Amanita thiersii Skay4041]
MTYHTSFVLCFISTTTPRTRSLISQPTVMSHTITTVRTIKPKKERGENKPAHWVDEKPSKFQNPWDSWHLYAPMERIWPYLVFNTFHPTYPNSEKVNLAMVKEPTWGFDKEGESQDKIKSTWLGHACFLIELPCNPGEPRGARVLFDPVFSKRCSANQVVGPKRYTPAPCKIEEIPDIDAIIISHDHYDHMDIATLLSLFQRNPKPHVFAPLGNGPFFEKQIKAPPGHVHILDWWESRRVEIPLSIDDPVAFQTRIRVLSFDVTCTPGQHFTGRTLTDGYQTLWSTWVLESPPNTAVNVNEETASNDTSCTKREGVKVFFGGDTGYRSVPDGKDEDQMPTCPVFREIGEIFGGFDFAMLPIGAYLPRKVMSPIHCGPQDSVRIFLDLRAKKALGMHWGTWILTTEDVDEPPRKLAEECKKIGIKNGDFGVCDIGETTFW